MKEECDSYRAGNFDQYKALGLTDESLLMPDFIYPAKGEMDVLEYLRGRVEAQGEVLGDLVRAALKTSKGVKIRGKK